ncbi:MAG TPA: hypothetical protein VIO59_07815 [Rhodanobacter sp.]
MGKIYRVFDDGSTVLAERKRAQREERDLQTLVEKNLDLLLGEEIDSANPRRWMLIKHEMPVPSPETGADLWFLDILVADQDAIPTLIECKLAKNGEAHREIVGQLFEYAANGRHYWTADQLLRMARATHTDLPAEIARLHPQWDEPEAYFKAVEANLREARMRLIFLLDEAPQRLKMQLDFFHGRMPTVELFVLELQQFHAAGQTFVSPFLIRPQDIEPRARLDGAASTGSGSGQIWDEPSFLAELASHVSAPSPVIQLLRFFQADGRSVAWGKGRTGAVLFALPGLPLRNFLSVQIQGRLCLNFWVFRPDEKYDARWNVLEHIGREICRMDLADDLTDKGPSIPFDAWAPHVDAILDALRTASVADHAQAENG